MILVMVSNVNLLREIEISPTQEPFTEMRRKIRDLPRGEFAVRFLCDREARSWMDIHGLRCELRLLPEELHLMRRSRAADSSVVTVYGIPIEIDDGLVRGAA